MNENPTIKQRLNAVALDLGELAIQLHEEYALTPETLPHRPHAFRAYQLRNPLRQWVEGYATGISRASVLVAGLIDTPATALSDADIGPLRRLILAAARHTVRAHNAGAGEHAIRWSDELRVVLWELELLSDQLEERERGRKALTRTQQAAHDVLIHSGHLFSYDGTHFVGVTAPGRRYRRSTVEALEAAGVARTTNGYVYEPKGV